MLHTALSPCWAVSAPSAEGSPTRGRTSVSHFSSLRPALPDQNQMHSEKRRARSAAPIRGARTVGEGACVLCRWRRGSRWCL